MGKLIVSENVTLDGVIQDPTGEEGFSSGGWFARIGERDRAGFAEIFSAEAEAAEAMLLGHRTYEWFAQRWIPRTGPWADRLRGLPKYVVGTAVEDAGWGVAPTPVRLDEVAGIKEKADGELVVNASGRLVRALVQRGLVDELRLLVYPYAAGAGDRLFPAEAEPAALRLTGHRAVGDSLVLLTYELG